jgi:LacI family transcriptional regulator
MQAAGMEIRTGIVEHDGLITPDWIKGILLDRSPADAVICMNWVCTMKVLRGMSQLRKGLIEEIAFLSFDDFELADVISPTISAVRQPTEAFGYEAARLLFERIKGEFTGKARSILLPTELILRESCGCHPARNNETLLSSSVLR